MTSFGWTAKNRLRHMNVQMSRNLLLPTIALALGFGPIVGQAQYAIDWFSVDGGGGTSTGGAYAVTGTIGQPDAGILAGGPYTLVGGFWGVIAAIQTGEAPALSITRHNTTVTVSWPAPSSGFVLEQTSTLALSPVPWTTVPFPYVTNAGEISFSFPATAGNTFLRLRAP